MTPDLPPLPEQAGWAVEMHGVLALFATNAEKAAGFSPGASTPIYTADQLREAQVKVLREARDRMAVTNELNPLAFLDRMADELEKADAIRGLA